MRKALSGIALAVLSLMFIILTTGSSHAAMAGELNDLTIEQIGYNARGVDYFQNRNKEFVDIHNPSGNGEVNLDGLVLRDGYAKNYSGDCNRYVFNDFKLSDGQTVRVYTGEGDDSSVVRSDNYWYKFMNHGYNDTKNCGYRGHYINNLADTLYVTNGDGSVTYASKPFDFDNGYYVN
jgi:hypothetical protein